MSFIIYFDDINNLKKKFMSKPILVDFKTVQKIKSDSFGYKIDIQKFVEKNM